MTDQGFTVTAVSEHRTDRGERTLTLTGAPTLSYESRGYRSTSHRTWRPTRVRFEWDSSVMRRVVVYGIRLRKDGSDGQVEESVSFRAMVSDDRSEVKLSPGRCTSYRTSEEYAVPDWLASMAISQTVPPFKGLSDVGA